MTNKSLEEYDQLNQRFWKWLVEYGYEKSPDGRNSLKKHAMWSEIFDIQVQFDDLQEELKAKIEALPNEVVYEVAKKILVPHGIDLDHIVHKHVGICRMNRPNLTNQQILQQAISKAIDGGWDVFGHFEDGYIDEWGIRETRGGLYLYLYTDLTARAEGKSIIAEWHSHELIFNHDFAKALWGDELWSVDPTGWHEHRDAATKEEQAWYLEAWQYRLQQMVVSEDPIAYLGENI